jgi:membrane fusion protein, hemolysin D
MNKNVDPPLPPKRTKPTSERPVISGRDREFLPAALEILETPPAAAPVALMLTLCAFVVVALIWSFIGRLDVVAVAQGKIDASGHAKLIQPLDPGTVAQLHVANGAKVRAGDLLLSFDQAEAAADEQNYREGFLASSAEVIRRRQAIETAQLLVPQTKADAERSVHLAIPSVKWEDSIPESLRRREEAVLAADLGHLSYILNNNAKQMAQKDATKERLNMSIAYQTDLIKQTLSDRVTVRSQLFEKGLGTKINLFDAEESLKKSQSALASDQGSLIETTAAIEELESERTKAVSEFMDDNQGKLAEAARKADDTLQQLNKARAKLARTKLFSPIDGTVQQLAVTTIGQVVTTGQQLMLITPDGSSLAVEALLDNQDIGFVTTGQDVTIKVDAFPFTRFGTLHGKVTRIATDAVDEQDAKRGQASVTALTNGNGGASAPAPGQPQRFVFPITISLLDSSMRVKGADIPLTPGMTVTAEIKTDSRRVIDYLFSPIAKVASEAMMER